MIKKIKKSRCFTIVLYPEDERDLITLNYITKNYSYAYILHNKDVFLKDVYNEKGELLHKAGEKKKDHFHVLFYFANPRSLSNIKEELNIDYLEPSCFYPMCRYLIHLDNRNKAQYSPSDIVSNIPDKVYQCLNKEISISSLDAKILLNYLKQHQYTISFTELTEFALQNDCIHELKKNCYFYKSFCPF